MLKLRHITNEELLQHELFTCGQIRLRFECQVWSNHPSVAQRPRNVPLRGCGAVVVVHRAAEASTLIHEVGRLLDRHTLAIQSDHGESASLLAKLLTIMEKAYACPDFVQTYKNEDTDAALAELRRLL